MNHDIEKALDNLEKRAQDIQHYMNIMSKVKTVNVADDQDFQREFDFFYKVRRNAEWRKVFFEIFERKKNSYPVNRYLRPHAFLPTWLTSWAT